MAGHPEITLKSNGKKLGMEYKVVSVDTALAVNKIPQARIVLQDGNWAKKNFAYSDKGDFDLGKELEILIKDQSKPETMTSVFKGVVVKHSLKKRAKNSWLVVDLKDPAVMMTTMRKTFTYQKKADQDIIKAVVKRYSKLSVTKIDKASVKHEQMVQYNATDWDFIMARAEANGLWVIVDRGQFKLIKPKAGTIVSTYNYGASVIDEFELQADIGQQINGAEASSWDVTKQAVAKPAKAAPFSLPQDAKSAVAAAKKLNAHPCQLGSYTDLELTEMQAWADAKLQKNRLSLFKGRLKVPGYTIDSTDKSRKLKPGDTIKIGGTSKYFNGKQLVSAVSHHVSTQGWSVEIQFGCAAEWSYEKYQVNEPPASGLIPGVNGLQIGVVEAFKADPNNKFRIVVSIPVYTDSKGGTAAGGAKKVFFARLGMPYATKEAGWFFIPEKGDEVILGFFNDDPRHPVILGSMYNPKNKMPLPLSAENNQKAVMLKKDETGWMFDSKAKTFALTTSKETGLNIKDGETLEAKVKEESVTISKGIALKAKEDIKMDGKNITHKASAGIKSEASSAYDIKGNKVNIKGSQVEIS